MRFKASGDSGPGSFELLGFTHYWSRSRKGFWVVKLRGHFAYYGITGNGLAIQRFPDGVVRNWKKWLARRRRRGFLSWDRFGRLLKR